MEAKSADEMGCVPCCRENMLEFFATSGDFTRRLTSVKANAKFSSPLSGPEDYYSVSQRPLTQMHVPAEGPYTQLCLCAQLLILLHAAVTTRLADVEAISSSVCGGR